MATYNGVDIFGPATIVRGYRNQAERYFTEFPGVNGRLSVRGGTRGSRAEVMGLLSADTALALRNLENVFETHKNNGLPHTLIDSLGHIYEEMILIDWQPTSMVYKDANGYCRTYTATFEGLK